MLLSINNCCLFFPYWWDTNNTHNKNILTIGGNKKRTDVNNPRYIQGKTVLNELKEEYGITFDFNALNNIKYVTHAKNKFGNTITLFYLDVKLDEMIFEQATTPWETADFTLIRYDKNTNISKINELGFIIQNKIREANRPCKEWLKLTYDDFKKYKTEFINKLDIPHIEHTPKKIIKENNTLYIPLNERVELQYGEYDENIALANSFLVRDPMRCKWTYGDAICNVSYIPLIKELNINYFIKTQIKNNHRTIIDFSKTLGPIGYDILNAIAIHL